MAAFREALIHDLKEDDFADTYAQTITYGLLTARVSRPAGLVAENVRDMVPITNPFLRDMLSTFLTVGGRKGKIDFDELGINDVVQALPDADMEAVLRDFGDKSPQEDPVIYFYELFLKEYDPVKRIKRGVFFTPRPVVSFVVRSVDEILRKEFGLEDGLADTTTWGEMAKRYACRGAADAQGAKAAASLPHSMKIPEGVKPDEPFVRILDPACGTGTFLVEVIDVIYRTMRAKWRRERHMELELPKLWNDYVAEHLLPRLYGFELMMAPYAIAHMKIGSKLHETGYDFHSHERARIYLTNSLEEPKDFSDRFEFDAPALAHEAHAVNAVKRNARFTVVVGNPPYSKLSLNWSEWIDGLLHGRDANETATASYYVCDGAPLGERTVWIQDDYIKFIRLSQWHIDRTGVGIHSYISNNGYLDNPTLRGMRQQLKISFDRLYVLDLHGSTKRGDKAPGGGLDQNVFDIQQGVAIGIFTKALDRGPTIVHHADLWGSRDEKYRALSASPAESFPRTAVSSVPPSHLFVPIDVTYQAEYEGGWKVNEIFSRYHSGIITKRDSLAIHWTAEDAFRTVSDFASLSPKEARQKYKLPQDVRDWKVVWAQADLTNTGPSKKRVIPVLYRPFDVRFTYFTGHSRGFVGWPVAEMTRLMLPGDNLALVATRMTKGEDFAHCLLSRQMVEVICLSAKTSNNAFVFPLYANPSSTEDGLLKPSEREPSLNKRFWGNLALDLSLEYVPLGRGEKVRTFGPQDVLGYIVAILHSPTYRERYREFLSRDFPRIPTPESVDLFREAARIGTDLIALHLLEDGYPPASWNVSKPKGKSPLQNLITRFAGRGDAEVAKGYPKFAVSSGEAALECGSEATALHLSGQATASDAKATASVGVKSIAGRITPQEKGGSSAAALQGAAVHPHTRRGRVYINPSRYFEGVPENVWNFHIGGYQVCEKWLKDRRGRTLSGEDVLHYQRVVVALNETIRLMAEIDKVIETHGGWPGAFVTSKQNGQGQR
jgi:hypothetical protein